MATTTGPGTTQPMPEDELTALRQVYLDMLGFVPPKVAARLADMAVHEPDLLRAQETVRRLALTTPHLDPVTVQLILVAVLGVQLRDATAIHIAAALRAGATEDQVRAALALAYLFGGQSVTNHTPEYLARGRELLANGAGEGTADSAPHGAHEPGGQAPTDTARDDEPAGEGPP